MARAPNVIWSKQLAVPGVLTGPVYTIENKTKQGTTDYTEVYVCGTASKANGETAVEG